MAINRRFTGLSYSQKHHQWPKLPNFSQKYWKVMVQCILPVQSSGPRQFHLHQVEWFCNTQQWFWHRQKIAISRLDYDGQLRHYFHLYRRGCTQIYETKAYFNGDTATESISRVFASLCFLRSHIFSYYIISHVFPKTTAIFAPTHFYYPRYFYASTFSKLLCFLCSHSFYTPSFPNRLQDKTQMDKIPTEKL